MELNALDAYCFSLMKHLSAVSVALYCQSQLAQRVAYAHQLAAQTHLALLTEKTDQLPYLLVVTDQRLELHQTNSKVKPLYVDFLSATIQHRLLHLNKKNELIAKAVGIKSSNKPTIIDATAGLGEDSFVLASLGCAVHCLERSPIVAALLQDGLDRFSTAMSERNNLMSPGKIALSMRLGLDATDAISYLTALSATAMPDVIYLDPMFPSREKSALVKKPMRMLAAVVGSDLDAPALLALALQRAKKRVVVKRPRLAPALAGKTPDVVYGGQSCRFDVYFSVIASG